MVPTTAVPLRSLFDDAWTEYDRGLTSTDPLRFTDTKPYHERLKAGFAATGLRDAVIVASGRLGGIEAIVAAMEFAFINASTVIPKQYPKLFNEFTTDPRRSIATIEPIAPCHE